MYSLLNLLMIYFKTVVSFNLDIESPDVLIGPPNSLFGYAVVSAAAPGKHRWVYVGAPKARIFNQFDVNVTYESGRLFGTLYECPENTKECKSIIFENKIADVIPSFSNILDDAWLGAAVAATADDTIVACGYRMMRSISLERYDMRGGCIKISPDRRDYLYYDFCDLDAETELLHEGVTVCESGMSLSQIQSSRSSIIAFGEPGAFQWSGRVEADYSDTILRQPYLLRQHSVQPAEYSYLGYSVLMIKLKTREQLTSSTEYLLLASAPRASNQRGEIWFFNKRFVSTSNFGFDTLEMSTNRTQLIGEQLGAYFGYSLAAGDLNGDGHTDLAVGAPFFYSKRPSYGGAVYIYFGLNGKFTNDRRQKLLVAPAHSRFGFAIACLPDLNKDGIDDLAISAPGESDGINSGSIYIYLGKDNWKTQWKFSQKIVPSQLVNVIKQPFVRDFGFSLATQSTFTNDLYQNSSIYPTLIVGSVDKQNLIIIYTLSADRLSTIGRIISTVNHLPTITSKQTLGTCKNQTFITKSGNDDFLTPIQFQLVYNISHDRNDHRTRTYTEDSFPMINATEEQRTIQFEANFYKGCGDADRCSTDLQLTADFVNGQKSSNISVLGIDSEIRVRLNLSNISPHLSRRKADPAFGTKIDIYYPSSYVQFSHAVMDDKTYVCAPIMRDHLRCKMTDYFNNPFQSDKVSITELIFTLSNISLANILRFDFNSSTLTNDTNIFNNNVTLLSKVLLKTDMNIRGTHEPEQVIISGKIIGLSSVKNLDQFGIDIIHTYTIVNSGPNTVRSHKVTIYWPYETLNNEWDDGKLLLYLTEEPTIELSPVLSNSGVKIEGYCKRDRHWHDHIDILSSINVRKKRQHLIDDDIIAITESIPIKTLTLDSLSTIRTLILTCNPNYRNVRCYPINCYIKTLQAHQYYFIKLRARLWNSTLIEDYFTTYDRVDIKSYAQISIQDPLIFQTNIVNDNASATTPAEFANRSEIVVPKLPLWAVLVGAMAGLILLIFIIVVCCLLGFFQRRDLAPKPPPKKKAAILVMDGTTTNSSSEEQQRATRLSLKEHSKNVTNRSFSPSAGVSMEQSNNNSEILDTMNLAIVIEDSDVEEEDLISKEDNQALLLNQQQPRQSVVSIKYVKTFSDE
ncbi:unnamed protein product [Didymodactylos carnosus]|uniref:Uncharacterized protein n=1 Tax=Didymodactylos carnosus TaxID=1234261 RepID=A0A813TX57_9BILA|nr:unnamed protein product [Didymodactylos carnosus]CAF0815241.1 unnamed protein product [Didymodactylos carnosus]CAF3542873.1 unnamed protein product [Didymodactylos carnosus]CAF3601294.1 unnamed protein product [Didymodactylos carnosus]